MDEQRSREIKPLPTDLSFASLFSPERIRSEHSFFDCPADLSHTCNSQELPPELACFLADTALLAYVQDAGWCEQILRERAGFTEVACFADPGCAVPHSVRCLAAAGKEIAVVSFRGTLPQWNDLASDADFRFAKWPPGGRVHAGFKRILEALCEACPLESWIRVHSDRPLWLTGHSLGAALAILAASKPIDQRRMGSVRAVVFGAPRVGDREFCQRFGSPLWRFVNATDLVPDLPPAAPYGYRHAGREMYLSVRGEVLTDPPPSARSSDKLSGMRQDLSDALKYLNGPLASLGNIPVRGIVDHSPRLYALRLWNAIAEPARADQGQMT